MAIAGPRVFTFQWVPNGTTAPYYRVFSLTENTSASVPENVPEHIFDEDTIWDLISYIRAADTALTDPYSVKETDVPFDVTAP